MRTALPIACLLTLASPALADFAANIPAAPTDWGTFIRGGAVAAGLYIAATIAGRLWIAWRQRRAEKPKD